VTRIKNVLEKLTECWGIPGFEDEVRDAIKEELQPICDEVFIDRMGNVIGTRKGLRDKPALMFSAHMDEVGFIIRYIDEKGFLRFSTGVGFHDPRWLIGEKVIIHTEKGDITGVIQSIPFWYLKKEEMEKVVPTEEMYIDIGASNKEEAMSWGIQIGSPVTFATGFEEMNKPNLILARALDNRCGCAVMIETMKRLAESGHEATIHAVGTVQEEVGCRGALIAAHKLYPDVAIVLDMPFPSGDTPGVKPHIIPTKMGEGVCLEILDFIKHVPTFGVITNRKLYKFVENTAKVNNIPVQPMLYEGLGTTDAATISLTREGIPVMAIAAPGRYDHASRVMVDLDDVENTVKLAYELARNIQNF